ncbi:hypothetical protein N4G70_15410 [Streptomyces sp. ASQP_92]|uniref:hypothetical protein n=1 Tax=Streptomyces sp. ASQP_92 TaxID=2979116 RepID=UPI0021BFDB60|nr:hypothetical protein [Streptomyces sp. ASQP_92]MCT9090247.1 hypothetical protein [Streptomyces sp. ASQP_92]
MDTTSRTAPHPLRDDAEQAFTTTKLIIKAYGTLSAAVLIAVVVRAFTGHTVTSFMWGRSAAVLASAAVIYWLTALAARGKRWAYVRVRIVSFVVPVAIVAVDVIPGTLPVWFIGLQAICALTLAATAFVVNGSGPRAAFPKTR